MPEFVMAVGLLIIAVSVWFFLRPGNVMATIEQVFGGRWLYAAALLRFLLGAGLIASAQAVSYTTAVAALGWLTVLGGLGLVVIPRPAILRMARWFGRFSPLQTRLWLLAAFAFGGFLVFAALA